MKLGALGALISVIQYSESESCCNDHCAFSGNRAIIAIEGAVLGTLHYLVARFLYFEHLTGAWEEGNGVAKVVPAMT